MSFIYKVSEVTLGGDGRDNPVPLTTANYQLTDHELQLLFVPVNCIVPYKGNNYQVTGLAVWDPVTQKALLGPNDDILEPCPPICG